MSDENAPPPPPTRITFATSMPRISWTSPDLDRVAVYNVAPLTTGERALLDWYRLPWWRRLTTRKPR